MEYKLFLKDQQYSWCSVSSPPLLAKTKLGQEILLYPLRGCRQGVMWSDLQLGSLWGPSPGPGLVATVSQELPCGLGPGGGSRGWACTFGFKVKGRLWLSHSHPVPSSKTPTPPGHLRPLSKHLKCSLLKQQPHWWEPQLRTIWQGPRLLNGADRCHHILVCVWALSGGGHV